MPLPKKLFAQVVDFAKQKGIRMSPKQTERALQKIVALGPTAESRSLREDMVAGVKYTGLLNDPAVKRAYAVGSVTTSKEHPKDLDILIRGRGARSEDKLFRKYDEAADGTALDLFTPQPESFKNDESLLPYKGKARSKNILKEQLHEGEEFVQKYGPDHKWIRLVGIPLASSLGLLAEGDTQEANAIPKADALRKLLPILQRESDQLIKQAGQPVTPAREAYGLQSKARSFQRFGEELKRVPEKEYSRIKDINLAPVGYDSSIGFLNAKFNISSQTITHYLSLLDPSKVWHEFAHARQVNAPLTFNYTRKLADKVKRWINDPFEQYMMDPLEKHAYSLEKEMMSAPKEVTQDLYDEIYRRSLDKSVRYVEQFLADRDPTFKGKLIKNIAIGSAVGTILATDGGQNEAQAMPRGVYQAIDYGAQLWRHSRDAKKLHGRTLAPGKVIDTVIVTGENERRIRFTDKTESIVDKKDISNLYRSFGTLDQEAKFALGKDKDVNLAQALKSLSFHEARAKTVPEKHITSFVDEYLTNLEEMGQHINPDIVFVKRNEKVYTLPKLYADLLEQEGYVEIVKTEKYVDILNRHKVK